MPKILPYGPIICQKKRFTMFFLYLYLWCTPKVIFYWVRYCRSLIEISNSWLPSASACYMRTVTVLKPNLTLRQDTAFPLIINMTVKVHSISEQLMWMFQDDFESVILTLILTAWEAINSYRLYEIWNGSVFQNVL